ncbi:hypothetical protein ACP8HI_10390 [Paenibacillus sp. FA6]|uniref:hypothetical protein n=1 Tax=Paenibacillus sp. FA6 TaxID=3413029 RepID=UPI003F656DA8
MDIEDYAYLMWGLIELYEATGDAKYLQRSLQLKDILVQDIWDEEQGGFFFSSKHGEEMPT